MLTAAAILGVVLAWTWLRRSHRATARVLWRGGIVAAALASFFLIPYALRISTLGSTDVLRYADDEPARLSDVPRALGYAFAIASLVGMVWWAVKRGRGVHPVVFLGAAALVVLFVLGEYVYPPLAEHYFGRRVTAFTPSRFLTDLPYFLAPFAGIGVLRLQNALRVPTALMVVLVVVLGITNLGEWKQLRKTAGPPAAFRRAAEWIRTNTPPDAIVLNAQPWTSFLTWRRSAEALLPISEPRPAGLDALHQALQITRSDPSAGPADTVIVRIVLSPDGKNAGIQKVWPPAQR
jgi:hypothetical protein